MNETNLLTPIMNKLEVMQQDITELKTDMNHRFTTLESDMDNRFTVLESDMNSRFTVLESELQTLEHTLTKTRKQCLKEFKRFRYDIHETFRDIGIVNNKLKAHIKNTSHHIS